MFSGRQDGYFNESHARAFEALLITKVYRRKSLGVSKETDRLIEKMAEK